MRENISENYVVTEKKYVQKKVRRWVRDSKRRKDASGKIQRKIWSM